MIQELRVAFFSSTIFAGAAALPVSSAHADPILESSTYRFGATYSRLETESARACALTCQSDNHCLSWSFVSPGVQSEGARCELKSSIGRAELNPSSTSGISTRHEAKFDPLKRGWITREETSDDTGLLGGKDEASTASDRVLHVYQGYKAGEGLKNRHLTLAQMR